MRTPVRDRRYSKNARVALACVAVCFASSSRRSCLDPFPRPSFLVSSASLPMHWSQTYSPVGGLGVSALLATLPVVTLLGLLAFFHVRAHLAALAGLLVALGLAVVVYGMPAPLALAAAGYGAAY